MLIRVFQIAMVVFASLAGYFYWSGHQDATFVSAVLAAACFFLNIRFQIKDRNAERTGLERDAEAPE